MAQAKNPFRATTDYDFRGADVPPTIDPEKGLLAWQGTITGDINGVIQWWMPVLYSTGQVSHFEDTRWEIWAVDPLIHEDALLLLAGYEAGTTTVRHGKNSVWRANGIVTDASEGYEYLEGRPTHDGGHFTWAAPGLPDHGVGEFRIN